MTKLFEQTLDEVLPINDPNKNYLEDLVGEGKKFKSVEDLARGKAESDAFIANLLREQAELRQELKTRTTMEDVLKTINRNPNPPNPDTNNGSNGPPEVTSVTKDDVSKLTREAIESFQTEQVARRNQTLVADTLTQVYGPNYVTYVKAKAKEIGVSIDWLEDMAARTPQALFKLLDVNTIAPKDTGFTPPRTAVNTGATQPTTGLKKYSDYQKVRKSDPKRYFSPQFQNEMFQAAKEAAAKGIDFHNT